MIATRYSEVGVGVLIEPWFALKSMTVSNLFDHEDPAAIGTVSSPRDKGKGKF